MGALIVMGGAGVSANSRMGLVSFCFSATTVRGRMLRSRLNFGSILLVAFAQFAFLCVEQRTAFAQPKLSTTDRDALLAGA